LFKKQDVLKLAEMMQLKRMLKNHSSELLTVNKRIEGMEGLMLFAKHMKSQAFVTVEQLQLIRQDLCIENKQLIDLRLLQFEHNF
jgi:hypothetical protein